MTAVATPKLPTPAAKPVGVPVPVRAMRTLAGVTRGRVEREAFILLHSEPGIGKSTLAALSPSPIFLDVDEGSFEIDVARFPKEKDPLTGQKRYTWEDVIEAPLTLLREPHDYKTFVLDSLDQAERLCWEYLCKKNAWKGIEQPGFGKGYIAALEQWQLFMNNIIRLREERGMGVILVAHTKRGKNSSDAGDQFDTLTIKMHDKSAGLIKERVDAVLFYRAEVLTMEKNGKHVAVQTNRRIIQTDGAGVYDAKNRFSLPHTIEIPPPPHSWTALADAIASRKPGPLKKKIETLLGELTAREDIPGHLESVKRVRALVLESNDDPSNLCGLIEAIEEKLKTTPEAPAEEGAST